MTENPDLIRDRSRGHWSSTCMNILSSDFQSPVRWSMSQQLGGWNRKTGFETNLGCIMSSGPSRLTWAMRHCLKERSGGKGRKRGQSEEEKEIYFPGLQPFSSHQFKFPRMHFPLPVWLGASSIFWLLMQPSNKCERNHIYGRGGCRFGLSLQHRRQLWHFPLWLSRRLPRSSSLSRSSALSLGSQFSLTWWCGGHTR